MCPSWRSDGDPIVDAVQTWRFGEDYFPVDAAVLGGDGFMGVDGRTRIALLMGSVASPVQYSDAITSYPEVSRLIEGLRAPDWRLQLQCVVVLVRLRASREIVFVYNTILDLEDRVETPLARRLLACLKAEFGRDCLEPRLSNRRPSDSLTRDALLNWAARAAGVTRAIWSIPHLAGLGNGDNIEGALAATISLGEIGTAEAAEALASIMMRGCWPVDEWAAEELYRLDANRLLEAVLRVHPGKDSALAGLYLGRWGNERAVDLIVAGLPSRPQYWRRSVEVIERLATRRHLSGIQDLASSLPSEYHAALQGLVGRLRLRLGDG
jgi:hypothetical protein